MVFDIPHRDVDFRGGIVAIPLVCLSWAQANSMSRRQGKTCTSAATHDYSTNRCVFYRHGHSSFKHDTLFLIYYHGEKNSC